MYLFHLARKPPQWLRVALVGLLLAFALNSVAHVTHRHDATTTSAPDSLACGHCASYGGMADAPHHDYSLPVAPPVGIIASSGLEILDAHRPQTSARPRAPPVR